MCLSVCVWVCVCVLWHLRGFLHVMTSHVVPAERDRTNLPGFVREKKHSSLPVCDHTHTHTHKQTHTHTHTHTHTAIIQSALPPSNESQFYKSRRSPRSIFTFSYRFRRREMRKPGKRRLGGGLFNFQIKTVLHLIKTVLYLGSSLMLPAVIASLPGSGCCF